MAKKFKKSKFEVVLQFVKGLARKIKNICFAIIYKIK